MRILFTGRKAHLTPALKALAESRLQKLEKFLGAILDSHVILSREKHRRVAEIVVKARARTLTAKGEAVEFEDALAVCTERLLTQARRVSSRRTDRRKGRGPWEGPRRGVVPEVPASDGGSDGVPEVILMGRIAVRPMSVREAILRAQDAEPPVLVFRDLASQQVSVLFRRPDGQFGLVETET
jgi:putative sigma-54 modulation protein